MERVCESNCGSSRREITMKKPTFVAAVLITFQTGLTFGGGLISDEWKKSNIEKLGA
jgi:hypothetical protein